MRDMRGMRRAKKVSMSAATLPCWTSPPAAAAPGGWHASASGGLSLRPPGGSGPEPRGPPGEPACCDTARPEGRGLVPSGPTGAGALAGRVPPCSAPLSSLSLACHPGASGESLPPSASNDNLRQNPFMTSCAKCAPQPSWFFTIVSLALAHSLHGLRGATSPYTWCPGLARSGRRWSHGGPR